MTGPERRQGNGGRIVGLRPRCELDVYAESPPLLEPGLYDAVGGKADTFRIHGVLKLAVRWTVLVPDANHPQGRRPEHLRRYYNVAQKLGRIQAPPHGDYRREWILMANRRPTRHDRLSPRVFENALARVEVQTVSRDRAQRDLAEAARYSKIGRIVELLTGGGPVR